MSVEQVPNQGVEADMERTALEQITCLVPELSTEEMLGLINYLVNQIEASITEEPPGLEEFVKQFPTEAEVMERVRRDMEAHERGELELIPLDEVWRRLDEEE